MNLSNAINNIVSENNNKTTTKEEIAFLLSHFLYLMILFYRFAGKIPVLEILDFIVLFLYLILFDSKNSSLFLEIFDF